MIDRIVRLATIAGFRTRPRRSGNTNAPFVEMAWVDDIGGFVARTPAGVVHSVLSQAETSMPGGALAAGVTPYVLAGGTLTNAQVKALRASPVTLVAAPGAGLVIIPHRLVLILDYGGTNVFTETADNLDLRYVGVASPVLMTVESTGFIDQSADTMTIGNVAHDKIVTAANSANKGVELFNNGDGEIGGNAGNDNLLKWRLLYSVVSTGL